MKKTLQIVLTTLVIAVTTKLVLNKKPKYLAEFENGKLVDRNFPSCVTIKI